MWMIVAVGAVRVRRRRTRRRTRRSWRSRWMMMRRRTRGR
jgi:hypothetical protein